MKEEYKTIERNRYEKLEEGSYNFNDPDAMRELELYMENDGDLYRQSFQPIIKNIQRKIKSGKYDHSLAPKLWSYHVEAGAKKYAKDFANPREWMTMFPKKDRIILAQKLADEYYQEIMNGEFD